jgi:hypothetical protein
MRRMVYFEAYGFNPTIYANRRYVSCNGLVLSSFRPVEVLIPYNLYTDLRRARVKKYVILKTTSNERVVVSTNDKIVNIYDREKLQRYTGKYATIPERIDMRLRTISGETDRMLFIDWSEVPSFLEASEDRVLILLAMYYVRSRLGMKMFKFDDYHLVEKLVKKLRYTEGLLVTHNEAFVYIPQPTPYIHYNDVRRALISLKYSIAEETLSIKSGANVDEIGIYEEYAEEELPF